MQRLPAELTQDGVVEMALERNALEDGLADDYAQYVRGHLEEIGDVLVVVKLVVSRRGLAQFAQP